MSRLLIELMNDAKVLKSQVQQPANSGWKEKLDQFVFWFCGLYTQRS